MTTPKKRWKVVKEEISIGDALESARDEIQSLSEEMCSWRDNMEGTPLENTTKYETVSECADILETQANELDSVVDIIEGIGIDLTETITISYSKPYGKYESRATRLTRALAYLESVKERIETLRDHLDDSLSDLEDVTAELEGIEFPSMY